MSVTIYHNARCSKSRQTLELLRARGIEPVIVNYLETPPTASELERILNLLGIEPLTLLRTGEPLFAELGLNGKELSREEWIAVMVAHPKLIERPIVVAGERAALGRPPENVLQIV